MTAPEDIQLPEAKEQAGEDDLACPFAESSTNVADVVEAGLVQAPSRGRSEKEAPTVEDCETMPFSVSQVGAHNALEPTDAMHVVRTEYVESQIKPSLPPQMSLKQIIPVTQQQEGLESFEKLRVAGAELRKIQEQRSKQAIQTIPVFSEEEASKAFEELRSLGAQARTPPLYSTRCSSETESNQNVMQNNSEERELEVSTTVGNLEHEKKAEIQALKPLPTAMDFPVAKAEPMKTEEVSGGEEVASFSQFRTSLADLAVVEAPYYESNMNYYESLRKESQELSTSVLRSAGVSDWMKATLLQREIEERAEKMAEEQRRLEEKASRQKELRARQNARMQENGRLKKELIGDADLLKGCLGDAAASTAMAEYVVPDWLKKSLLLDEYAIPVGNDSSSALDPADSKEVRNLKSELTSLTSCSHAKKGEKREEHLHKSPKAASCHGSSAESSGFRTAQNSLVEEDGAPRSARDFQIEPANISLPQQHTPTPASSVSEKKHSNPTPILKVDPAEIAVNAVAAAMQAGLGSFTVPSQHHSAEAALSLSGHTRSEGASSRKPRSDRELTLETHRAKGSLNLPSSYRKKPSSRQPRTQTSVQQPQKEESMEERTANVQREISKAIFRNDLDRLESVVLEAVEAGVALPRADVKMIENLLQKERMEAITGTSS